MIEIDTKILDTLFRRMPPSQILNRLCKTGSVVDYEADRRLFHQFSVSGLDEYSINEKDLIYKHLSSKVTHCIQSNKKINYDVSSFDNEENSTNISLPSLALYSILMLSQRVLTIRGQEPMCHINQVLPWREAFLLMGQDIFVCAFLANEDLNSRFFRRDFTWSAAVRTNHITLNTLLRKGISENHHHLFGSSQTFALSWCNLMNYPESHSTIGKEFEQLYMPFVVLAPEHNLISTKERVRYACLCRSYLFNWLHSPKEECANCCIDIEDTTMQYGRCWGSSEKNHCLYKKEKLSYCNNLKLWNWLNKIQPESSIFNEIRSLRILYGAKVPQPNGSTECIDYALEEHIFWASPDSPNRALAGERHFLYQCFQAFFQNEMDDRTQLVFYLYVILKTLFRSELIQVNKQFGFQNFSNYQDRKTILCERPCYYAELIRLALNAPLSGDMVKSLETRITPKNNFFENLSWISEIDRLKQFADCTYKDYTAFEKNNLCPVNNFSVQEIPYFFVFHFIKKPDTDPQILSNLDLQCRHQNLRKELKKQSIALAKALSISTEFSQRIRGIDSASNEIGCPPEVFATTFRFLRNYRSTDYCRTSLFSQSMIQPCLSATYHVGEDFLDIASALRSIDEAITFLELKRGDRIGHALGLGINPEQHYALKGNRVFLRKQDRLDDLVWLMYRSRELGVRMDSHLYGKLKSEAEILLLDIYGNAIENHGWHTRLTEYYCSMQLRADDPELYNTMEYNQSNSISQHYNAFKISSHDASLERYRKTPSLAGMYYYYHYGNDEKKRGNQVIEVIVDPDYVNLIYAVQDALQDDIERKGIIIECNPSSNVLIGTFGKYSCHPIFRFNNTGLERNMDKYKQCKQLQVCINTDDLGVFDTSQEFEYALLFHALSEMRNSSGEKLYKEWDILQYLNTVRQMGNSAVFQSCNNSMNGTTYADWRY